MKNVVGFYIQEGFYTITFEEKIFKLAKIDPVSSIKLINKFKNIGTSVINGKAKNVIKQFNFLNHYIFNDKYEIIPNIPKIESCYIDGKIRYRIESAQSINRILNVDFAVHSMINKKFKIVGIFESISDNVEYLEMFLKFLKTFFVINHIINEYRSWKL